MVTAGSGFNISSLRHPDGASNPNLKEEVERVPGNGASISDHEEETTEKHNKWGHIIKIIYIKICVVG